MKTPYDYISTTVNGFSLADAYRSGQRDLLRKLKEVGKEETEEYGFYDGSILVLTEHLRPICRELEMTIPR